ncbi:metalloprotease [Lithospermum erythrorhizon]|uniref:Mitochondrial inner membrane protease ATP23 n=1 Tax=Lithospermum erythrorhizon TaxID=34254 RepID=A0AAV3P085_LITER
MEQEAEAPRRSICDSGATVEECEKMISKSLRSPMAKFLIENMEKSGCRLGNNFFEAINCENQVTGGYIKGEGIKVCSNHMLLQDDVNQVVFHELIHAYDECRAANLDWSNCAHHACSEIRAGHLSGDCHYKREFLRGNMKLRGHEQLQLWFLNRPGSVDDQSHTWVKLVDCVKRRVMKSVMANPHCSGAAAKDAMDAVWDTCYNDTQPFDRAP